VCVAVDAAGRAFIFNGTSWSGASTIDSGHALTTVSCVSSTMCVAADNAGNAFTYNGSVWSGATSIASDSIVEVSCPDSGLCVAVDATKAYYYTGSWSSGASIDAGSSLTGVSCSSEQFCVAVDFIGDETTYNGSSWSSPTQVNAFNGISSISCSLPLSCQGVDYSGNNVTYANGSWSQPQNIDGSNHLTSISCPYSGFCVAVDAEGNALTYTVANTPGAPSSVTATAGNQDAAVTWGPAPDGGSPITSYTIVAFPSGASQQVGPNVFSVSFTGLTNGTTYYFSVTATNAIGSGPSADSNKVVPSGTSSSPPSVTGVSPASGPSSGMTPVTVTGVGFTGTTKLTIGGVSVSSFKVVSDSQITFATPSSSTLGPQDIVVTNANGPSATTSADKFNYLSGDPYHALSPARLVDTRNSSSNTTGYKGDTLSSGNTLTVAVTGNLGVPSSATAVVINVTVTNTTADGGYLTIYPDGATQPTASNLNWNAGETIANLVTVGLPADGKIDIYNAFGSTDVIVDVEGYFGPNTTASTAGLYNPIVPQRLVDTRQSPTNPTPYGGKTLGPGTTLNVQVTGVGSIPAAGVSAVVLNLTSTNTTSNGGYFTIYPTGVTPPTASNLNWTQGLTIANRVIVPVSSAGQITIANAIGSADAILDVTGWFTDGTQPNATGGAFNAIVPARICDTRSYSGNNTPCAGQTLQTGQSLAVQLTGQAGIPTAGAVTVVTTITATSSTKWSFVSVSDQITSNPTTSDVNWSGASFTETNESYSGITSSGVIYLYNAFGSVDLIVSVNGWFS
jgi:hypothetical protein